MRWLRNAIMLILLSIFLIIVYQKFQYLFIQNERQNEYDLDSFQYRDASIKLAYILSDDKWLEYALQPGDELVRVMSNAIMQLEYQLKEEDRILYSIRYEVIDEDGNIIRSNKFYHRSGQKKYQDESSGQKYVSTSVYPHDENPVDSRIHLINMRGLVNAQKIRFKIGDSSSIAKKIVVRTYQRKKISGRKLDYAWQRISVKHRKNLAKVSVYDESIINEQEQRELLKNQWAPLGPLGIEGEDYSVQKLYVVREVENNVVLNVPAVPSTGQVIYPGRYGVITLPEDYENIKLSWSLFDSTLVTKTTDKVTVEWWGHPATRYKKWQSDINDSSLVFDAGSGILRISSQQPIVIRAWSTLRIAKGDEITHEITPDPAYIRLYSADTIDLVYKINHIRGYKTPYRFDLRSIDNEPVKNITYRILNENDQLIRSGQLHIPFKLTAYDAIVAEPQRWITEPFHAYFNFSHNVSKIIFSAPTGVWLSAYSRPKKLPYKQVHPKNTQLNKMVIQNAHPQPVWFGVRPDNWKHNMRNGRSQLITVQRRAPQVDKQIQSGQYRWDQFFPSGSWKGRYILEQSEENSPFRIESRTSRYVNIHKAINTRLMFIGKDGSNFLRPSLIYSQSKASEVIIRVWVDDKLSYQQKLFAKNGEIRLPGIVTGEHILRVDYESLTDDVDFYINSVQVVELNEKPRIMHKRVVSELTENILRFEVLKEKPEELLALRFYSQLSMTDELQIKVKINGLDSRILGPFEDWTLMYRMYELHSLPAKFNEAELPLMLDEKYQVSNNRLFFIPLGTDMPSHKKYRIDVELLKGRQVFVALTRSIPGLYPSRKIYPDVELVAEHE